MFDLLGVYITALYSDNENNTNKLLITRLFINTALAKAIANGPVGQVLAGPLFLKVKTKFYFTKSK